MSIVAVGALAFDSIRSGAGSRERILGGSLTHFSNAASFLSKPKLIGVVGVDFTQKEWDFLKEKSSSVEGVEIIEGEKSFFWQGHYTDDYNTAITEVTELNAFAKFQPKIPQSYKNEDYMLFLANIHPNIQLDVAKQCADSKITILDTMNFWIETTPDELSSVFKEVDGIIINEGEAQALSGEANLLKAVDKLFLPRYKVVILKKGSNGVLIFGKNYIISLPAYPLKELVDPTGAGDSFAGAFFSYIDANKLYSFDPEGVKAAAVYATVVASFYVEDFGVEGLNNVSNKDIEDRINKFKKIVGF